MKSNEQERPTLEELRRCRESIARLFNAKWLDQQGEHRLQILWRRKDRLAQLELFALAHAIDSLAPDHQDWLSVCAKTIRKQPQGAHGHIFEMLMIGALVAGGGRVAPMPSRHAGHDVEVTLGDGHVLRVSIKNHDVSMHEAQFRQGCRRLKEHVEPRVRGSGGAWRVFAGGVKYFDSNAFKSLEKLLSQTPMQPAHLRSRDGHLGVSISPLGFPDVLAGSYQLIVRSPNHPNEQDKFRKKLRDAVRAFSKNSAPLRIEYSNVVLMRVHPTANITRLHQYAEELVADASHQVDAIVLYQAAVANSGGTSTITYHAPAATSELFRNRGVQLQMNMGVGQSTNKPTSLQLLATIGEPVELADQYLFQRGHLYYELKENAAPLWLRGYGPGIQSSGIFRTDSGDLHVRPRKSEDDELMLL